MGIVISEPSATASHGIAGSPPLLDHQSLPVVGTVPINSRSPDARLIRLCADRIAIEAEQEAIWAPFYDVVGGEPSAEEQARSDALAERKWRIEDMIARARPRTAEGREAKACVLLMMVGAPSGHDDPCTVMARSLALDVLPVEVATDRADEAEFLRLLGEASPNERAAVMQAMVAMMAGMPQAEVERDLRAVFSKRRVLA